jgi:hypothetical protein
MYNPPMQSKLTSMLPLALGVTLGASGAIMFQKTLPPEEGSPEEKIAQLQHELKKTRTELNEISDLIPRKRFGPTTHDGVRSIAFAMKTGQPVTPDDIFNAFKPLMRDLSPLTQRMSELEAKRRAESMAGEYARKYGLNDDQQKQLIEHLAANQNEHNKTISNLIESDHTSVRDFMEAERNFELDTGLDAFMAQQLKGEELQAFKTERITEKSERAQQDADLQVERIDNIVKLDEQQRHQMFLNMAQTSRHYDPQMQFEGLSEGTKTLPANTSREDAMLSVLHPEQRAAYQQHKQEQLVNAQQEAAQLGLTIPHDWNPDDDIW